MVVNLSQTHAERAEESSRRLLREYVPGERVRATAAIFYADGDMVREGELGTVSVPRYADTHGVALVYWDRLGEVKATCCEAFDPAAPS